jgi:hypothetical protein
MKMVIFRGTHARVSSAVVRVRPAWASLCVVFVLAGCGSRGPEVHLVEGVVTLDGLALAGADVGFSPAAPGKGISAVGGTRDDGSFTLNAVGAHPGRGTAVGEYIVTVRKFDNQSSQSFVSYEERGRDAPPPVLSQPGKADPPVRSLVPEVYGSLQTSPLRATVSHGRNSFRFELKSD